MGNPQVEVEGSAQPWRLAIVGSRSFSEWWKIPAAEGIIRHALARFDLEEVISGGAAGIDALAAQLAQEARIPVRELLPASRKWDGPDGFKARNEEIARSCSHVLCIRDREAASYGSGWTADRAESLGRVVRRILL